MQHEHVLKKVEILPFDPTPGVNEHNICDHVDAWHISLYLRLHYVPGGHDSHDFGHRGRNGVTVTQRRGTGSTNVARRGCRDRRDRFLNSQKTLPRQLRRD